MKVFSKVIINKPVEEVWAFFDNPDNLSKWLTGFVSFENISGLPGQVGTKSKHIYENNGKNLELIELITSRIENKEFKGTLSHKMMVSTMDNQFKDLGNGRTELTADVETKFKSLVFQILSPIMKRNFQKRQDEDLRRLKYAIENDI